MKRFMYGLALALGLAGCSVLEPVDSRDAVVRIEMAGGICTGFYVRKDTIVTAGHCVNKDEKVKVWHRDGTVRDATAVRDDDDQDVAVIVLDKTEQTQYIPLLCDANPRVGDYVRVIGHPRDVFKWFVSFGRIGGQGKLEGGPLANVSFLWFDASVAPGNSGGPLLNSQGYAIGVISITMGGLFSGATPIQNACKLVG